jgi:hypothetical protein
MLPLLKNYVLTLDNVLSSKLCDEIIERFENDQSKKPGLVTSSGRSVLDVDLKSSTDLVITGSDYWKDIDESLYQSSRTCFENYKHVLQEHAEFLGGTRDEAYFVRKYDTKAGYYGAHADAVSTITLTRKLALIWYLNDVEEGGETEFVNFGYKVKPKKGSAALFPTDWMYAHKGNPPISNEKYIARTFLHVQ